MSNLALSTLGDAIRAVAYRVITEVVITTENDLVILRVPLSDLRLHWTPAKARAVAGSLCRMAERIERFRIVETDVAE